MATYRSNHIQPNTIAMVPVHGYINRTNFSPDSIRWLDFVASSEGVHIQHALNGTGERKISGISVDGYCGETKTIYQYQVTIILFTMLHLLLSYFLFFLIIHVFFFFKGCFFHGCGACYSGDVTHPLKNVTMATLRQQTEDNVQKLRARGYTVIEMWEHTFTQMKKESPELQSFLSGHDLKDRLKPRDAFFGGRTNAVKLYHEGDVKYIDFTSLYPWVSSIFFHDLSILFMYCIFFD